MALKCFLNGLTFLTLEGIAGLGKRKNDVLFSCASGEDGHVRHSDTNPVHKHVIFFPGDVQNYHEVMQNHSANHVWSRWSFENTSSLLHRRFPNSYVWVIKPSRIHEGTFSCYDNFLPSDMFGSPVGFENFGGLLHLRNLLSSAVDSLNAHHNSLNVVPVSRDAPLTIVGFSKGCAVLNQFLHELKLAKTDPDLKGFLKTVSALYWLDAGHNLGSGVWVTDEQLLKQLLDLNVELQVHVTPRQVRDPGRPHIGEEERIFVDFLKQQGADIKETLHFADEDRTMEQHFRILETF